MQPTTGGGGPAVTVLFDPTADNPRRLLPADAVAALVDASLAGGTASVVTADGAGADAGTPLLNVGLSDPSAGPSRARRVADVAVGCLQRTMVDATASAPGSDLLTAWQTAARHTPTDGRLLVVGSGVPTAGVWDLTRLPAGQVPPADVIEALPDAELPGLAGRSVTFYGLGDTAASPPLSQTTRTWLVDLNVALCAAAGAASPSLAG